MADLTTLRLGGPAGHLVSTRTTDELIAAAGDRSALIVAGGSNLVVADEGFPGTVVLVRTSGVRVELDTCGGAMVTVAAGEVWDELVVRAVHEGWRGIETLSGIPGSVGATPIQNVGAYGQEVADTIASVRCWDRTERVVRTFAGADCGFSYRSSRFKREPGRYVVLEVTFQFRLGDRSAPIGYAELARSLDVAPGETAPTADVRDAVLALRRSKGMVLDPSDHDTWSTGSFFTNPILPSDTLLPPGAPRWPQPDRTVKTSAAWLIESAGFTKGYAVGRVALSTKHTLALTNRGGASTAELLSLAAEVRRGVRRRFAITLENEPVLVGCVIPH
ncbi:MAG: UDP-N-acetylmuramate dehydrogenase [Nocardioidaceae bacterium]